ncbi:S-adenosyl-L-methionine-dependent methyltransferase [Echria macrotheca]|uniref:S-adenosyl-L-methionine-dependent methyltransferase n=1 Tax=Echria macrotheca TaxID=438768 RepID=A0AAJ0BE40_9PEZI|nr:S-adenosyl-L-methionine-dependent methyltransferase [Echria macrotheca]
MAPSPPPPKIDPNPALQRYYSSLESRLGYTLLLGGTRHFGYYPHDTYNPFPINRALRAMEDKLFSLLSLPRGAHVLDAGCGEGFVAQRMARVHGLRVTGIDVVEHHLARARRNTASEPNISLQKMDYHHLDPLPDASLDGVYTVETFVHATEPEVALAEFFRVLRPGGRLALLEYDHTLPDDDSSSADDKDLIRSMEKINRWAAMPTNRRSHPGVFRTMLEDAGFQDVVVTDLTENIMPMARLFFVLAIVPYFFVRLFGLERWFINTIAGVETYRGRGRWRYIAVTATKPGGPLEIAKDR